MSTSSPGTAAWVRQRPAALPPRSRWPAGSALARTIGSARICRYRRRGDAPHRQSTDRTGLLLLLDGSQRVIRTLVVAAGGATKSVVPVREVLSVALRHDAVAMALAHNHPGGSPEPSDEDTTVTRRVQRGAKEVGLRFLDHVIVAGEKWCSITASRRRLHCVLQGGVLPRCASADELLSLRNRHAPTSSQFGAARRCLGAAPGWLRSS